MLSDGARTGPRLLVLSPSDQRYRELLKRYHAICEMVGPLPPPTVVSIDHGYQRFLLFALPAQRQPGSCVTPAMAWIDTPLPNVSVSGKLEVRGWAFKDGIGLSNVELLLDGRPVAQATYGKPLDVRPYWKNLHRPTAPERRLHRHARHPRITARHALARGCACTATTAAWKIGGNNPSLSKLMLSCADRASTRAVRESRHAVQAIFCVVLLLWPKV